MDMTRQRFSLKFKFWALKLATERGASIAQFCRELEGAESVLRSWMRGAALALIRAAAGGMGATS